MGLVARGARHLRGGGGRTRTDPYEPVSHRSYSGADPENLHGRWLTGWLLIVNHTGAKGVAG